ncbi:hypothetical protein DZK25_06405 [Wenzhouxiangella sp. 15181]|nr:hypothetical protein DZK25_06405 [Wenzhouxiangella sp. 15181]RFP69741.1 hypothetical protein DZK26_02300 [Wenzhouxiangella sp. 15190]
MLALAMILYSISENRIRRRESICFIYGIEMNGRTILPNQLLNTLSKEVTSNQNGKNLIFTFPEKAFALTDLSD